MNKSLHKVIETLQAHMAGGTLIWHNPCLIKAQSNLISGNPYHGVNQLLTALAADAAGYRSSTWATFKQIRDRGGELHDAKGKGVPILFYTRLVPKDDEDGQERFVIRHSSVFNLDLVSGIDLSDVMADSVSPAGPDADAQGILAAYLDREQIRVSHGMPAYLPSLDVIRMPAVDEIATTDEYYSTVFHELAHSTGHPNRLCRFGVDAARKDNQEDYSREELVAEITSALLCHGCGVDSQASIKNSAAYLQGWSRFIARAGDAFLSAVNQAYKARAFILAEEGAS